MNVRDRENFIRIASTSCQAAEAFQDFGLSTVSKAMMSKRFAAAHGRLRRFRGIDPSAYQQRSA
jgi:hypothetical protein